ASDHKVKILPQPSSPYHLDLAVKQERAAASSSGVITLAPFADLPHLDSTLSFYTIRATAQVPPPEEEEVDPADHLEEGGHCISTNNGNP
ncbi:Uncharacterized protein FKW44_014494, partial [Caligus rogercresseyi]